MNQTALQVIDQNTEIVPADVSAGALQAALAGDLSKLSGEERLKFYGALCRYTGLNPLAKPFDWIQFQGKLILYPNKGCAEQLRTLHQITFDEKPERKVEFGVLTVTVCGKDKSGRRDFATAAVPFSEGMPAADKANALMKCETKAKRRFTLSICGLTMFARDMDETEEPPSVPQNIENIETATDRAALLNAGLEPIDVEANLAASPEKGPERTNEPPDPRSESTPAASPVLQPASNPASIANSAATSNPSPKTDAAVPLPNSDAIPPSEPTGKPLATAPATDSSPAGFVGLDGKLTEDTIRNIEIVLSEKNEKQCIEFLVARGRMKKGADLETLAASDAKFILTRKAEFYRKVDDWAKGSK